MKGPRESKAGTKSGEAASDKAFRAGPEPDRRQVARILARLAVQRHLSLKKDGEDERVSATAD